MTGVPETEARSQHEPRPTTAGSVIAVFAALTVVIIVLPGGVTGAVGAAGGVLLLAAGLVVAQTWLVTGGVLVQVAGLALAGLNGLAPVSVLLGLAAILLAWDTGQYAITLGKQIGADGETMRMEIVHAGATTLVVGVTAVIANGLFSLVTEGQPFSALAALALAAILLVLTIRRRATSA